MIPQSELNDMRERARQYREEERRHAEERRRIQEATKRLYDRVKQGENPFQMDEVVSFHTEDIAPELTEAQKAASQDYLNTHILAEDSLAKTAIRSRNLDQLKCALGPEWYAARQAYWSKSNESQLAYLKARCQLVVLNQKGSVLVEFAKQERFPDTFTESQRQELREKIKSTFEANKINENKIKKNVESWGLDPSLAAMVRAHLTALFKNAKQDAQTWVETVENVSEAFYALSNERSKYGGPLSFCKRLAKEQVERSEKYHQLLSEAMVEKRWADFQSSMQKAGVLDEAVLAQQIQELRSSRFSERGLYEILCASDASVDQATGQMSSLLDYAVVQYNAADEDDQKALLPLIEQLLIQGDRPITSFNQLDWSLLVMVSGHADLSTHYGKQVAVSIQKYSRDTEKTLAHWYTRWFVDTGIKAERQQALQSILAKLYSVEAHSAGDQQIADEVQRWQDEARSGLGGSSALFETLSRVNQKRLSGQLIAMPPMPAEVEMQDHPQRYDARLWQSRSANRPTIEEESLEEEKENERAFQ